LFAAASVASGDRFADAFTAGLPLDFAATAAAGFAVGVADALGAAFEPVDFAVVDFDPAFFELLDFFFVDLVAD
jgi:hypothetical protein